MKEKYKEFSDKFEDLCDEYATEDFNVDELKKVCNEIIENYGS
jgi:hypothetical protein